LRKPWGKRFRGFGTTFAPSQPDESVLSVWSEAAGMAGRAKPKITDKDFTGLKYFEKLLPLFARLHEVGCARDKAGNRNLHFDEYCCLVLLFFFNPIVNLCGRCSRHSR
jgi:hypothetical protein